jgi:hypothetical protein
MGKKKIKENKRKKRKGNPHRTLNEQSLQTTKKKNPADKSRRVLFVFKSA